MSTTEQSTAAIPIRFLEGALSVQIPGSVPVQGSVQYKLRAETGQRMIVNLIPKVPMLFLVGTIAFPDGQQTGGPGGVVMSQVLGQSGIYTISVQQSNMHPADGGSFVLEVVILPEWLQFKP